MLQKEKSLWRPSIPIWVLFSALSLLCVVFVLQDYVGYTYSGKEDPFGWEFAIISALSSYLLWAGFSPLIYRVSRAFAQGMKVTPQKIAVHLLFSIGFAFLHRIAASLALFAGLWFTRGQWFGGLDNHTIASIMINVFSSFVIYWIFIALFLAVDYYKKFQEKQLELVRMENELNNAQLSALKMQLHPHFLFNTLHAIAAMMDENIERAQKMVSQMGYLLRSILDQDQKHTILLKDELNYIRNYLDIEQTRFRDRLHVEYDTPKETLNASVPNLILQPIVENAIKHGFSKKTDSGTIRVISRKHNGRLELVIEDDGKGVKNISDSIENGGIGLKNVQRRLAQMYPENHTFDVDSPEQKGFVARIQLPFQESHQGED